MATIRCSTCDGTGRCLRRDIHNYIPNLGTEEIPSHDAYGNPYQPEHNCHVCEGVGSQEGPCIHNMGFATTIMSTHESGTHVPRVVCCVCQATWTCIPSGTRIHSGMFDILADSIKEGRIREAKDIMNAYLDWRPSNEKQLSRHAEMTEFCSYLYDMIRTTPLTGFMESEWSGLAWEVFMYVIQQRGKLVDG